MTFESLALAGLSIGLSYSDILDMRVGLIINILNEKNNQLIDLNKKKKEEHKDEVVVGDASMLMNM